MFYSKLKYILYTIIFLITETILFLGTIELLKFLTDFTLNQILFYFIFFGLNTFFFYIVYCTSKQEKEISENSIKNICNCDFSKLSSIKGITIKNKKLCFETKNGDIFINLTYIFNFKENSIFEIDNYISNYITAKTFNGESLSIIISSILKK